MEPERAIAVIKRFNSDLNFDIISEEKVPRVGNCVSLVISNHIGGIDSRTDL
jgi:hypothetical protein